jgi:hypothetical protein
MSLVRLKYDARPLLLTRHVPPRPIGGIRVDLQGQLGPGMSLWSVSSKASWLLYPPMQPGIEQECCWPKLALQSSESWESCEKQAGAASVPLLEIVSSVEPTLELI